MAKPRRPWTITPHGPIEKLDDNLWAVSSAVPGVPLKRRMSIVRRSDGDLLFFNAVPMDEPTLAEVRAWGKPAFLVVAHDQHCIDAHGFSQQMGVKVYGPKACDAKTRLRVDLAGNLEDVPPDAAVTVEGTEGVKHGEPVLFVKSGGGARVSFLSADVFQNQTKADTNLLFRMLGFVGPKTPPIFKLFFVHDKPALRAQMARWAATPNLARLVPCHGDVIEDAAAAILKAAAERL